MKAEKNRMKTLFATSIHSASHAGRFATRAVRAPVLALVRASSRALFRASSRALFLASIVVGLTACGGVGSQEDSSAAQVARDSQKIQARYNIVAGTYNGMITFASTGAGAVSTKSYPSIKATLFIYTVPIVDGKLADGSAKIRPELRARFRLDEIPTPTDITTMVGDYDQSGKVSFASLMTEVNPIQLAGQMLGGQLRVDVSRQGGVWGTFASDHTSTSAAAPAQGYIQEEYERYRILYHTVEGTYTANVKMPKGKGYGVEIVVSQNDETTSTSAGNVLLPALAAHYRRLDVIQGEGIAEYTLRLDYDGLTHVAIMQSISPDKAIPGSAQISVRGEIVNHVLKAQIFDKFGYVGDFIAVAKNIPPLPPLH